MANYTESIREIIDRLVKLTNQDKIAWQIGATNGSVKSEFSSGHVEVKHDIDSDGQEAIRVNLYNDSGHLALIFDDTELGLLDPNTEQQQSYYPRMRDLLVAAARKARGEDKIVEAFVQELRQIADEY